MGILVSAPLFLSADPDAVKKYVNSRPDCLMGLRLRGRQPQSKYYLQMQIVADHADEAIGKPQAVAHPNLMACLGMLKNFSKSDRRAAGSLFVESLDKIRKAIGFGDRKPIDADHRRRHIEAQQMTAEDGQYFGEITLIDVIDRQTGERLVGIPRDNRSEEALLVAELAVYISLRAAGALDDRVDARRRITLLKEDLGRRLEKGFPSPVHPP